MATLFVRHDVSDFEKWKQAYDNFDVGRNRPRCVPGKR